MNKKVFLVTCILCFSLSFFSLNVFNRLLWGRIYMPYEESSTHIGVRNSAQVSVEQFVEKLFEGSKLFHVDISKGYMTNGKLDHYLIASSSDAFFSVFPLLNKDNVTFSDDSKDIYYTSDVGDQLRSGLFYTVIPYPFNSIAYHNFNKILSGEVNPYGGLTIYGKNENDRKQFIQFLKNSFPGLVSVPEVSYDNTIDQSPKVAVLFISTTLFLLILLMEISKNLKEISLRKSLGESFIKIEYELFGSFLLTVILVASVSFITSYALLIHTINVFTFEYMGMLLKNFGILILITVTLLLFIGSILYFISPIGIIKNRNFNKSLYDFNFVIKIVFIVLLFPEFLNYTNNIVSQSLKIIDLYQSENDMLSTVQVRGINPSAYSGSGGLAEAIKSSQKTVEYLKEHGAVYINYTIANIPNDTNYPENGDYTGYEYVEITADYSSYLPPSIQNLINQNKQQTFVLVNKNTVQNLKYSIDEICVGCNVITTDINFKILNYKNIESPYARNPVLVVYPDLKSAHNVNMGSLFFITSSPEEAEVVMAEATLDFDSRIVFSNNSDVIRSNLTMTKTQWYYIFIVFIEGLIVILLVINHGITVLYDLNKKEIAIHYLSGYSFLQRSSYIVLQDALLFGLLWFYLWSKDYGLVDSFGYAALVMSINFIFASLHLLKNEKKQAIDAIKNS